MCAARTVKGMGQSSSSAHKEITKLFRSHLTDRSMEVRKVATEVRSKNLTLHFHGEGGVEEGVW